MLQIKNANCKQVQNAIVECKFIFDSQMLFGFVNSQLKSVPYIEFGVLTCINTTINDLHFNIISY